MQKIIEQLEKGYEIIHIDRFEKEYQVDTEKANYAEAHLLVYSQKWNGVRRPLQVYKGDKAQWTYLKSTQVKF